MGEVNYGAEFLRWFSEEAVRINGRYTNRLLETAEFWSPKIRSVLLWPSLHGTFHWPWEPESLRQATSTRLPAKRSGIRNAIGTVMSARPKRRSLDNLPE